jgi:hypothetical protein
MPKSLKDKRLIKSGNTLLTSRHHNRARYLRNNLLRRKQQQKEGQERQEEFLESAFQERLAQNSSNLVQYGQDLVLNHQTNIKK